MSQYLEDIQTIFRVKFNDRFVKVVKLINDIKELIIC